MDTVIYCNPTSTTDNLKNVTYCQFPTPTSPRPYLIPSALLLIQANASVHQHSGLVMMKDEVCLLNYVYAIESQIAAVTVTDSHEYL